MPRAKAQSSLAKNQMQLALALSSSLEESKKQELSKLTEELPASTIEDGDVPQNIKQMQKEFLERLQLPKPGPSKKILKKALKPVPTLLAQSSEERLRILTEKVSLVLLKEDGIPSSAKNEERLTRLQEGCQGNALWNMSWMLSSEQTLYYIDCLAMFIPPSEVTLGSKLNNAVLVPRRLTTPVKYRPLPSNDSSQLSNNSEQEISSYIPQQANFMDPDFETRLEFQNDWQKLLNNSELSDITITVKGGSHVWAHKLVLFVRCQAALDHLANDELFWTKVDRNQALAFLEYIYSGKLTAIHMLGERVEGVLFLARMYKVTDLLKHLSISDLGTEASAAGDRNESVSDLGVEASDPSHCIVSTPKKTICSSPDIFDSPQRTIGDEKAPNLCNNPPCDFIEVSSDEEVKQFFGTFNPTVVSPIIKSDSESEVELVQQDLELAKQLTNDSEIDMFSSPSSSKCCLSSPEKSRDKTYFNPSTNVLHVESPSDEEGKETINTGAIMESISSYSPSQRTCKTLLETSTRENHIFEIEEENHSSILSTPCSKRKQSYIDGMNKHSKRRKALSENVPASSPDNSPVAYSVEQNLSNYIDYSFNNKSLEFKTKGEISLNKHLVLNQCDHKIPLPKRHSLSPSTNDSENEKNLLDDSFKFDINDSVLLRQPDSLQTPDYKSSHLGPLRTPLDNVKTSSPATPMPDYDAMTDTQFQLELERFGLKRGLSRSKGIKMLTHIYGKLHPLVQVVSLGGKKLAIPLAEKTPGSEISADDEPLSQQSVGSSGDDCIMLEETMFDDEVDDEEEKDITPGVSSYDLKTAVRTWISSQPEIHEMILSYEPIWLDSFHVELKNQFDKKIKLNQLIDVLDEEGITFRSATGQQNRRRKRNSPKKKRASPKK